MSVVLPAPFGPMIACVSPCTTSRSTPSVACKPPNLFASPRIARSGSATAPSGVRHEPEQPALGEEHDEDEERPQDDLPVGGEGREDVLQEQEDDGADHRTEERSDAAEDHHEHD